VCVCVCVCVCVLVIQSRKRYVKVVITQAAGHACRGVSMPARHAAAAQARQYAYLGVDSEPRATIMAPRGRQGRGWCACVREPPPPNQPDVPVGAATPTGCPRPASASSRVATMTSVMNWFVPSRATRRASASDDSDDVSATATSTATLPPAAVAEAYFSVGGTAPLPVILYNARMFKAVAAITAGCYCARTDPPSSPLSRRVGVA
jgi:hypothetical protein